MASERPLLEWPPVGRLVRSFRRDQWLPSAPVCLARAPGRLDVMGGIADYSGSLVCEMPLAIAAAAAAQMRSDGVIICRSAQAGAEVRLDAGVAADADPLVLRKNLGGTASWARYLAGCAWWLAVHGGAGPAIRGGCTLCVDSDVPLGGGVSSSAAVEVATMSALAAACGVRLDPMALAAACQQVENLAVGAPCGVMDQATAALGRPQAMLELLCQPDGRGMPAQVIGTIAVPRGFAFVGIHSGVRHEVSGDPYTDTRVAAFMAQKIISTAAPADAAGGWLANVQAARFSSLEPLLPETMGGREFLDRHGGTIDRVTTVRPERDYHVRRAARHHVLEMHRVRRFVALVKGPASEAAISEAGDLMLQSHRSYGDCARLGHELTDRLVEMVMQCGPGQGLYGAKITGGGCGGTVAILMRDEQAARRRLAGIRDAYTRATGRGTMLFEGTSPGAALLGTAALRPESFS